MSLKSRFSEDCLVECGCDEAGRGSLAGPLYAAAVVFPNDYYNDQINDSKQLNRKKRETLRELILRDATAYAVVSISEKEIDQINILNASIKGMNDAVKQLSLQPELLLIDGNRFYSDLEIPYQCIVKGDATFLSIAAASILAKTYRDDFMESIDNEYPMYGWKSNKGYPTAAHQRAILEYGLSPYHRKSFHLKNQLTLF